jgi:fucose 4-O-acetylase-like acetyltransferase
MYMGWILFIVALYFCPDFWIINELKYLSPFFVASIALSKCKWDNAPNWFMLLSVGCYIVMFHYYGFSISMYRMGDNVLTFDYLYGTIFRSMIGLFGCVVSIALCKCLAQVPYVSKYMLYLGGLTLPIYVLHQKLFMWNMMLHIQLPNMFAAIMGSVILIQLSIFIYKLLKENRICALVLFGENYL